MSYYVGIDVGTGSARACIINEKGEILGLASKEIAKWEPKPSYINQSSTQIWDACCECSRKVVKQSGISPELIKGIGFDGTCSLVVLDRYTNEPVAVGPDFSNSEQNIILWMDHRPVKQTKEINKTKHKVLKYVGGQMSIEMEIPKVKWLKDNLTSEKFKRCKFYDLADFLTFRASDVDDRSYCSVVCKQGFLPVGVDGSVKGWMPDFLSKIGLQELVDDHFEQLGGVNGENGTILSAGQYVGNLSSKAAAELGLTTEAKVGSGVIDAYAGWIGTVGAKSNLLTDAEAEGKGVNDVSNVYNRLAAVAGTSTCHLVMSKDPIFVPGVWGPYRDVLFPDRWMAEGGQSATGELLRFVLASHPAYPELQKLVHASAGMKSTFEILNDRLEEMRKEANAPSILYLGRNLFFYGDLYGNRSPIADNTMRGAIIGLDMNIGLDGLALQYLGAVEFIAQQTRHIIETMNNAGHSINSIFISGGQCRNKLLMSIMSTATQMPIVTPRYIDAAVVLGSAMLGAKASSINKEGKTKPLWDIMCEMSLRGSVVEPDKDKLDVTLLHSKYKIFLDMANRQREYRSDVHEAIKDILDDDW